MRSITMASTWRFPDSNLISELLDERGEDDGAAAALNWAPRSPQQIMNTAAKQHRSSVCSASPALVADSMPLRL